MAIVIIATNPIKGGGPLKDSKRVSSIMVGALLIGLLGPTAFGFQIDRSMGSFPAMTVVTTLIGANLTSYVVMRVMRARFEQIAPPKPGEEDR